MDLQPDESNNYRVEVSGWDARESFFVEKTLLAWEEGGRKQIMLRAVLRPGCVVFVRLLQSVASGNNFPVAYQAIDVAAKDRNDWSRVSVQQLRPREAAKEQDIAEDPVIQVA
jgi:hypothetical protein